MNEPDLRRYVAEVTFAWSTYEALRRSKASPPIRDAMTALIDAIVEPFPHHAEDPNAFDAWGTDEWSLAYTEYHAASGHEPSDTFIEQLIPLVHRAYAQLTGKPTASDDAVADLLISCDVGGFRSRWWCITAAFYRRAYAALATIVRAYPLQPKRWNDELRAALGRDGPSDAEPLVAYSTIDGFLYACIDCIIAATQGVQSPAPADDHVAECFSA